jgi:hypothetical protein
MCASPHGDRSAANRRRLGTFHSLFGLSVVEAKRFGCWHSETREDRACMQDLHGEHVQTSTKDTARAEAAPKAVGTLPPSRERHTWRLIVGLSGLLGVAWAAAIVSRYPNILPG